MSRSICRWILVAAIVMPLARGGQARQLPADAAVRRTEADFRLSFKDAARTADADPAKGADKLRRLLKAIEADRSLSDRSPRPMDEPGARPAANRRSWPGPGGHRRDNCPPTKTRRGDRPPDRANGQVERGNSRGTSFSDVGQKRRSPGPVRRSAPPIQGPGRRPSCDTDRGREEMARPSPAKSARKRNTASRPT